MTALPFAEPFGLAWLGLALYVILFVVAGYILLVLTPAIVKIIMFTSKVVSFPWMVIFGKKKKGVKAIAKSGKQLFKINRGR